MMKKGLIVCLALLASTALANAQIVYGAGTGGGGGGSGTVTQINTGAGLTGGPITTTGTIAATEVIRAVTGTTDTILSTDAAELITYSNAAPVAVTLPQATGSFAAGFAFTIQNKGAGLVTVTPTTSTINGAATLTIAQNTGCDIVSDGTNYQVAACTAIASGSSGFPITLGTTSIASGSTTTSVTGLSIAAGSSNTIATTGAASIGTSLTVGTTIQAGTNSAISWTGRGVLTSPAAGDVQLGLNSATPVAQTLQFANGSGTNIAGADTTIDASQGSGNAAQGSINFTVGTPTTSGAGYGATINALKITGATGQLVLSQGIVSAGGTIPTATGTGTPTVTTGSTDFAGSVTAGATATSVVITSGNIGYTTAPFCIVQPVTQLVAFAAPVTVSAGRYVITVTQTATSGNLITWHCVKNT